MVFYPYCTPSVEVTVNTGRPVRPPRRHRTPWPLLPVTLSWVFYRPDPTQRRPGWAGGRASPSCAPTWTPLPPGPTLHPHLPMGTISAITSPLGPGRAGSPIWALRPPHPAGLGFVGISFVAFYEESRTPPRSPPHPPRGSTFSPQPTGPRDHSGWTNPGPGHLGLSLFPAAGEGRWGLPLTTPVAVPTFPLSIPGKIKRQNCT